MFQLKKRIAVFLTAAIVIGCLAGCQSQSENTVNDAAAETEIQAEKQTDAVTGEREKLVIALAQNSNVEDYDDNHMTRLLEEEMDVDIEFYYLPADLNDARMKFATMVNGGGTLPDVVVGLGWGALEVADYGSKGIFMDLTDYINDPEMAKYFHEIPETDREYILKNIASTDGRIYAMPKYNTEDWNATPYRFWINRTWLDAVGEDMPQTTDEFRIVMEKFMNEDPNGNGLKDEIAITGSTAGWGTNSFYFLINAFEYTVDNNLTLSEDGTKVIAPFTTDAYRNGLQFMNELCEDGILSPTIFTQDATQLTAILSNDPQIVGCTSAGGYGYWADSTNNPNFQDMELLPPLTGPEGKNYAVFYTTNPSLEYMITKDCKNPELAFKLGDLFYRSDVSITSRFGEEGVDWSTDPEVTCNYKGIYEDVSGIPCSFALLNNIWSQPQNKSWYDVGPTYRGAEFYRGVDEQKPEDPNAVNYYALTRAQSAEYYAEAHPEYVLPNLIYTQEEADEIAEIMSNVKGYVNSCNAAFVTGNMNMEEWDSYLKELENMGLNRWLEVAQAAYDRMMN